jgi:hypothetical protein
MRVLNLLFVAMMLGFAAVQYNDPDALLWAVYYLVPAGWGLVAAWRPGRLQPLSAQRWLWLSAAAWTALMIFYWPPMPGFWRTEVFMQEETAREGMGMMLAWLAVVVALLAARLRRT